MTIMENSLTLELPIYWVNRKKTKKSTTHLLSMNFYRNAHYHIKNKLKSDMEAYLDSSLSNDDVVPVEGKFTVEYKLYYKNPSCDPSNVIAIVEKIFLDFAQTKGIIKEDNTKFHLGSTWSIAGQDKVNPRCIIYIRSIDD